MNDEKRVEVLNGEYTVVWGPGTTLHVFCDGELCLDSIGGDLIVAMAMEILELREKLEQYEI